VEVERREVPAVDFYPDARQVVTNGGSVLFQVSIFFMADMSSHKLFSLMLPAMGSEPGIFLVSIL
jgi:hypothetical protein